MSGLPETLARYNALKQEHLTIAPIVLRPWAGMPVPPWATLMVFTYQARLRTYGHKVQTR